MLTPPSGVLSVSWQNSLKTHDTLSRWNLDADSFVFSHHPKHMGYDPPSCVRGPLIIHAVIVNLPEKISGSTIDTRLRRFVNSSTMMSLISGHITSNASAGTGLNQQRGFGDLLNRWKAVRHINHASTGNEKRDSSRVLFNLQNIIANKYIPSSRSIEVHMENWVTSRFYNASVRFEYFSKIIYNEDIWFWVSGRWQYTIGTADCASSSYLTLCSLFRLEYGKRTGRGE